MDFIYAKFDNNLVDINRIEKILLLRCDKTGEPISSLKIGDYYLKLTIIDSNIITYCDLSALNTDTSNLLEKLNSEIDRAKKEEYDIRLIVDEKENKLILKIDNLNETLNLRLDTLTDNINNEKLSREQKDAELDEKFTSKINELTTNLNSEINTREQKDTALKNDIKILDKKVETTKKELLDNLTEVKAELETSIESNRTEVDTEINIINEKLPLIVYLNIDFIDLDSQVEEADPNYLKIKNAIKEQAQTNKPLIFIEKSGYQYELSYVDSKPLTSSDEFYNYYFSCVDENTVYYLNIAFNDISYKPLIIDYTYTTSATTDELKAVNKKLTDEENRAKKAESDLSTKKQDKLIAGDNITIVNNKISATSDVTKSYVDEQINEVLDTIVETTDSLEKTLNEKIKNESTIRKENDEELLTAISDEESRAVEKENSLDEKLTSNVLQITSDINNIKTSISDLKTDLNSETTIRSSADEKIQNDLTTETINREAKYNEILIKLNDEISNRETTDNDIKTNLNTKISEETTRATSAEDNLRNALTNKLDIIISDQEKAYVVREKSQSWRVISNNQQVNAIPYRDENGNLVTYNPVSEYEAVNKKYVDIELEYKNNILSAGDNVEIIHGEGKNNDIINVDLSNYDTKSEVTEKISSAQSSINEEINTLKLSIDSANEKIKSLNNIVNPENENSLAGLLFEEI